jgi:hypothetical protein
MQGSREAPENSLHYDLSDHASSVPSFVVDIPSSVPVVTYLSVSHLYSELPAMTTRHALHTIGADASQSTHRSRDFFVRSFSATTSKAQSLLRRYEMAPGMRR